MFGFLFVCIWDFFALSRTIPAGSFSFFPQPYCSLLASLSSVEAVAPLWAGVFIELLIADTMDQHGMADRVCVLPYLPYPCPSFDVGELLPPFLPAFLPERPMVLADAYVVCLRYGALHTVCPLLGLVYR
jgi:hypothetical protein